MIATLRTLFTGKNFMRSVLSFMWSAFAMSYLFFVTACDIAKANAHIVDTILGFLLGTAVSGILMYYYGTSQGSTEKDETIRNMSPVPDKSKTVTVTESEVTPPKKE